MRGEDAAGIRMQSPTRCVSAFAARSREAGRSSTKLTERPRRRRSRSARARCGRAEAFGRGRHPACAVPGLASGSDGGRRCPCAALGKCSGMNQIERGGRRPSRRGRRRRRRSAAAIKVRNRPTDAAYADWVQAPDPAWRKKYQVDHRAGKHHEPSRGRAGACSVSWSAGSRARGSRPAPALAITSGSPRPSSGFITLGDETVRIGVKDYRLDPADPNGMGQGVNIREGNVRWPVLRQALESVNFSGWMTIEGSGDLSMAERSQRLDQIIAGA